MKIAIPASGPDLESPVDPRFARCAYFIIYDTDNDKYDVIQNPFVSAPSGAGIQVAQMLLDKGVNAVLVGNIGPNAYQVLASAGIQVLPGVAGTVKEAIEHFKRGGTPPPVRYPSPPPAPPLPPGGPGFGWGRGFGRGWGFGRGGWGWGGAPPAPPQTTTPPSLSKDQEIAFLEEEIRRLEYALEAAKKRLKELKGEQ